jgi:HEPN domain-containing protein
VGDRARDWFAQAERDLEQAQDSRSAGRHEWAVDRGKVLDTFSIPARYPNSHPEGAPFEHYGPLQSEEALEHAGQILDFVRAQMADA